MPDAPSDAYDQLLSRVRRASLLGSSSAILSWDQETMMPKGGVEHRARQLSQLAEMSHELATDPRVGELLQACEERPELAADPHGNSGARGATCAAGCQPLMPAVHTSVSGRSRPAATACAS